MSLNKVYIVRHAESEYNLAQHPHNQQTEWTEKLEIKFSKQYIDCDITPLGYE